ncbi:Rieske (2Fe-2S) protein [Oxalobacteraceae bacterium OTU3CAMAD1]|nr:Rieske (2Fe-2S) protein [Oxalobacteraceae bacterium OTU3CAMAD1]
MYRLCSLDDIADGAARGFDPCQSGADTVLAVRRGRQVHVYLNRCPHNDSRMEYMRHRFLSHDGRQIMCYAHGARFDIGSGVCTDGPCKGSSLTGIPARVQQGDVLIARRHLRCLASQ